MMVWFTVQLEDKPGSLARVAAALGERGVNITGIVGVAEDTDGALMLTTSDPDKTRQAFESSSATARTPSRSTNRRSSAGASGLRRTSMNWISRRRSLKNRWAARVACESGVPKTWAVGAAPGGPLEPGMAGG